MANKWYRQRSVKVALWLAAVVLLVLLLRTFAFTTAYIPSSGMENSLLPGDRILVNKWSYGLRLPFSSGREETRWGFRQGERGEIALFHHPAETPSIPLTERPLYIGRLVGLPGDTLLVDSLFNLHQPAWLAPDCQQLYTYPPAKEPQMKRLLASQQLTRNRLLASDTARHIRSFSRYEYYLLEQASANCNEWLQPLSRVESDSLLRPLVVPKRGVSVEVTPWNITLLRNTLVLHEQRQATIEKGELLIDGKPVKRCTFTQDYYWVGTNNPINLSDSRLFGFVPHSHLIGRATRIWFSQQPGQGVFKGYRWNRVNMKVF